MCVRGCTSIYTHSKLFSPHLLLRVKKQLRVDDSPDSSDTRLKMSTRRLMCCITHIPIL